MSQAHALGPDSTDGDIGNRGVLRTTLQPNLRAVANFAGRDLLATRAFRSGDSSDEKALTFLELTLLVEML